MRPRKSEHMGISNGGVLQGYWLGKTTWEDSERLSSCWDFVASTFELTSSGTTYVEHPIHFRSKGVILIIGYAYCTCPPQVPLVKPLLKSNCWPSFPQKNQTKSKHEHRLFRPLYFSSTVSRPRSRPVFTYHVTDCD